MLILLFRSIYTKYCLKLGTISDTLIEVQELAKIECKTFLIKKN
jgi:hypothetical protein